MPLSKIEAGVGAALVGGQEVDDGMAADLLLAVEGHPDVDRQGALLGEQPRGLQEEVRVPLVVDGAASVEPAVPELRLERIRLPEVERRGRLDVEVPVEEDGRRLVGAVRGGDLTDGERERVRGDELGPAAGCPHEVPHPLARTGDVLRVGGVRAHARDAEPFGELLEPGGIQLLRQAAQSNRRGLPRGR